MNPKLFGEFKDLKKDDTITFRLSSTAKEYFKQHAESYYGSTQKAMDEVFKRYMETITFKRGVVNRTATVFLPKANDTSELERDYDNQLTVYDLEENSIIDTNEESNLSDNIIFDNATPMNNFSEYMQNEYKNFLIHEGDYTPIEDYILITFNLNNYLDVFSDGMYCSGDIGVHEGLVICNYNGIPYYIHFRFGEEAYRSEIFTTLISNKEAYDLAMHVDNLNLAEVIDGFNDGISNIEKDKSRLLLKKKNLEKQIKEIDLKLKNLK